jgi:CelD/BcsL family acetyltransferase involved in cellulose biosynthesis
VTELSRRDPAGLESIGAEWDRLAELSDSPFLTIAWYSNWLRCFAADDGVALVLRAEDGTLLAGGCFREGRRGALSNAVNEHSSNGGIVARDASARRLFWEEVAALGRPRLNLDLLIDGEDPAALPAEAISAAGYRTVEVAMEPSPWMDLPDSLEGLLAERSRNFRSQVGRKRRRLEKEGELILRVNRGDDRLEEDLDAFFALEAAGWKGEEGTGTAIAGDDSLLASTAGSRRRPPSAAGCASTCWSSTAG